MSNPIGTIIDLQAVIAREWAPPTGGTPETRAAWYNGFREAFDIIADEISEGYYDNGKTRDFLARLDELDHIRRNA